MLDWAVGSVNPATSVHAPSGADGRAHEGDRVPRGACSRAPPGGHRGCYRRATLRELPSGWVDEAFTPHGGELCLRPEYREGLDFRREDLRQGRPEGPFHLVLCRNVAFTYFAPPVQREVLARLLERLVPGGLLAIGAHESLPEGTTGLAHAAGALPLFRHGGTRG